MLFSVEIRKIPINKDIKDVEFQWAVPTDSANIHERGYSRLQSSATIPIFEVDFAT